MDDPKNVWTPPDEKPEKPDRAFTRGKGPLCSILLPTRGRPGNLAHAIDSFYSLAKKKANLEFILKLDDDDEPTQALVEKISKALAPGQMRWITSPRGRGYHDMHTWVNQMCGLARGDWLWLVNDDCVLKTEGWDDMLERVAMRNVWHECDDVVLLLSPTIGRPHASEFLLIRRQIYEILGHWSLSPHCDNWLWTVMQLVASGFNSPFFIHHYSEQMTDATRNESEAAYKTTIKSLNSTEAIRAKIRDAEALLDHIDKFHKARAAAVPAPAVLPTSGVAVVSF